MNVCHVTPAHSTFDTRVFHKECKTLVQAGHDVTLIVPADWDEKIVDGVRVIGLPTIKRRYERVRLWRLIVKEVRKLRPDVVHLHNPEMLLVAPLLRPSKLIYDCEEGYSEDAMVRTWIPAPLRYPTSKAVAILEPALARWVDEIIVTVEPHAVPFQKAKRPISILYNFPLLDVFDVPYTPNGKALVHVGTQNKVRGCGVLVEAMRLVSKRVPDAELLFVGPFDEPSYEASLRRLADHYGLREAIVFTGLVPYGDVPHWIARSRVGLIALQDRAKFRSCIPTKLFEYMGCGVPVVASDLPPARRFMEGLNCGFMVDPADPQAYAEAIEYLLLHPEEARQMGENGRRAVEEKYNWGAEAEKLLDIYEKLEAL
jgi:glycosyltransferase involved in cell wall biosynthesis